MNRKTLPPILQAAFFGVALPVFVVVGEVSKVSAGSTGGSKSSASSSKPSTISTSSDKGLEQTTQPGANMKIGDYPVRDIDKITPSEGTTEGAIRG